MDRVTCDVVRDLLPIYVDGIASKDTEEIVEEHVKDCEGCREELNRLRDTVVIPISKDEAAREAQFIHKIKRGFRMKKVRIAILSTLLTAAVIIGLYCLAVLYTWTIPYDESLISVEEEDGKLYVEFNGENYYGTYGYDDDAVIMDNGEKKQIYIMCFEENLWSRYIDPILGKEIKGKDRRWEINDAYDEIPYDIVYYGDVSNMIRREEPFTEEELAEMTVLWEKPADEE